MSSSSSYWLEQIERARQAMHPYFTAFVSRMASDPETVWNSEEYAACQLAGERVDAAVAAAQAAGVEVPYWDPECGVCGRVTRLDLEPPDPDAVRNIHRLVDRGIVPRDWLVICRSCADHYADV